ncbi:MAG: hypothetical protein C4345_13675 [Chloroflexota bacterium]
MLTNDPTLKPAIDQGVPLTQYVWELRYPGELNELPRVEAEGARALAREVYAAVLARLPAAVRP